jgi:hypothetical protein
MAQYLIKHTDNFTFTLFTSLHFYDRVRGPRGLVFTCSSLRRGFFSLFWIKAKEEEDGRTPQQRWQKWKTTTGGSSKHSVTEGHWLLQISYMTHLPTTSLT